MGFDRMAGHLRAAADAAGERPLDRLRAIARAYLDFGFRNTGLHQVMLREVRSEAEGSPEGRAAGLRALELLVEEIASAQAAGELPEGPPSDRLLPARATMHGFVQLAALGPLPGMGLLETDSEATVGRVVEASIRALR